MHLHLLGGAEFFHGEHLCAYRNQMRSAHMQMVLKLNQMGELENDMPLQLMHQLDRSEQYFQRNKIQMVCFHKYQLVARRHVHLT